MPQTATYFKAIFDGAVEFIGLLSPDGTLLHANRAALNLARATLEDVANRPFWEGPWWASNPQSRARLRDAVAAAARGEQVRYEVDVLGADGISVTLDFSLAPAHDDSGAVSILLAEGHDITARRGRLWRACVRCSNRRWTQSSRSINTARSSR
jgi:PAS domain S-box-containing protein